MDLKHIRIAVSTLVLVVSFVTFLGNKALFGFPSETVLFFQFIPSLIHFFGNPGNILGFGFLAVVVLSVLYGRVYCSFLCPLGVLQDLFIFLSRKTGVRRKHVFMPAYALIRYSVLIITAVSAGLGSLVLVNLLDPYSLFGRISAHLFKWVAVFLNNRAADVLVYVDYYGLYAKMQHAIPLFLLYVTLFFFLLILAFSFLRGRSYCNIICPVGAFLGLLSRYSLWKFVIDKGKCKSCGVCQGICKSGCIDPLKKEIDPSRCVACFDCLSVCGESALHYVRRINPTPYEDRLQVEKRRFLLNSAAFGSVLFGIFSPVRLSFGSTHHIIPAPITPPGALSISRFTKTCTACHLCISACKTHVLTPNMFGYGMAGFFQPSMDFQKGHCDFNCHICGSVCPTGSISPLPLALKQRVRIGWASLNESLCVVYTKKTHCGACGEACPTFAISPKGVAHHFAPVIHKHFCIGCGACEKACPTKPKAIFITASRVHDLAEVRVTDPLPRPKALLEKKDRFPF